MVSNAEIRTLSYQAGGCSLSVTGEVSPLSQMRNKTVLRRLQFQLQLLNDHGGVVLNVSGVRSHLLNLNEAVSIYLQGYLSTPIDSQSPSPLAIAPANNSIYLEPQGLTRHRLHLRDWGLASAPQVLELSSLQLGDLAQVLGQLNYAAEILPMEFRRRRQGVTWRWVGMAAGVVLAVGGLATLWPRLGSQPFSQNSKRSTQATLENSEAENEQFPDIAIAPQPKGPAFPSSVSEPIEAQQPLEEEVPEFPSESELMSPPLRSASQPSASISSQLDKLETNPNAPKRSTSTSASTPRSQISDPVLVTRPTLPSPQPQTSIRADAADLAAPPAASSAAAPTASPENVWDLSTSADTPEIAAEIAPETTPASLEPAPPAIALSEESSEQAGAVAAANSSYPNLRSFPAETPPTTPPFPQNLESLRQIIQQQWQPPAGLSMPLFYRLEVNSDGSLQAIIPLSEAASQYQDQAPLPELGTTIPHPAGITIQHLTLTLLPNGEVRLNSDPE